jgi:hypothetical protein
VFNDHESNAHYLGATIMASIIFSARGDSFTARVNQAAGGTPGLYGPVSTPTIVSSALTGMIGSNYWDLYKGSLGAHAVMYPAGSNCSPNRAQSILVRGAFQSTGLQGIFTIGGPLSTASPDRIYMYYNAGNLVTLITNEAGASVASFSSAFTPTIGVFYDILLAYTGDTTGSGCVVYVDAVSKGTATFSSSLQFPRSLSLAGQLSFGSITFDVTGASLFVEEVAIADYKIDPTSVSLESGTGSLNGASRTSFLLAPTYNGAAASSGGSYAFCS